MDEVIAFIKKVFEEMYQLEVLDRTEPSFEKVEAESNRVDQQYFHGTTHGVGISAAVFRTPEIFIDSDLKIKKRKAPILFQIKEYDDAKWGRVYKVYSSSTQTIDDSYTRVHFVAKYGSQWKIIGQYDFLQGIYEHRYGVNFDHLKNPLEVRKFQPPNDPADFEEYNSE
jgi:hypothetical protein